MAKYTSHFKQLSFYVNGVREQFRNGEYETTDKATADVLDTLNDVKKVSEPKKEAVKTEDKPVAAKATPEPKGKPSGK